MNGVEATQSSMNESPKLLVRFIYPRKPSVSRSHCPTPPIPCHSQPQNLYKHRILTRLSFDSSSEGRERSGGLVGRRSFRYCRWDRNTQPAITSQNPQATECLVSNQNLPGCPIVGSVLSRLEGSNTPNTV